MATLDFTKVFDQETGSDLIIKFGGQSIKAHKVIMTSASPYFEKACGQNSKFKVTFF